MKKWILALLLFNISGFITAMEPMESEELLESEIAYVSVDKAMQMFKDRDINPNTGERTGPDYGDFLISETPLYDKQCPHFEYDARWAKDNFYKNLETALKETSSNYANTQ